MGSSQEKFFFPFVLDHKPGFFLSWLLYTLFKRIRFNENMADDLKQMHRQGTVVYAIKYRGRLDYLLYHYRFRRSRLPYPKIGFDLNMALILPLSQLVKVLRFYTSYFFKHGRLPSPFKTGFFRDAIQQGTASLLCLVDPKGFARHFINSEKDHLHFLLEVQKDMERPIYIVPQLILYKKSPEKENPNLLDIFFGFKEKPGFIRKIGLFFRHHQQAFIDFGEPLNLKTYLEEQPAARPIEDMATEIRHMLIENIDGQKRVILGPVMKSRQQLKEEVLKDQEITKAIERTAAGNPKRRKQLRKNAGGYFDEMAADYNITYVQLFHMVLTWLWKKIFQGIDVDLAELAVVREWARRGPIIYVPSHKSHIDYLVLNDVLFSHQMHIPRIAAGKNLAFWPVGHIFRKSGAFFIRRNFKGTKLYSRVFTRYIKALLKEGHPLEFFIEGGRSRNGKLLLPKTGFLSILFQAHQEGYCDDLVFIPTSISYDRIIEEKSYLKELRGGVKKQESFKQVLKARHTLKRKYGKIYIRFGQPLSLTEYLPQNEDHGHETQRRLAFHLARSINNVTPATPLALITSAILTKHRRGFHLHELVATAEDLNRFLRGYEIPRANSLNRSEEMVEETLSLLIKWNVVDTLEDVDGAEIFYYVDEEKKRQLEYYKNSLIHWFISHAFVAISLLSGTEELKTKEAILSDYHFLKELFENEFVYDEEKDIHSEIDRVITYFLNTSFIVQSHSNGGYKLTRLGFDKLPIWAGLAKTFIESYWIAARSFLQEDNKNRKRGDLLKNMNYMGQRFHKQGIIEHLEAISQVNFENAIRFINKNILGLQGRSEEGYSQAMERLAHLSHRLYDLSHFKA